MAEPFKNLINAEVVRLMRRHLQRAWAGFDGARFEAELEARGSIPGVGSGGITANLTIDDDGDAAGGGSTTLSVGTGPFKAQGGFTVRADEDGDVDTSFNLSAGAKGDEGGLSVGIVSRNGGAVAVAADASAGTGDVRGTIGLRSDEQGVDSARIGAEGSYRGAGGRKADVGAGVIVNEDGSVDGGYVKGTYSEYVDPNTVARVGGDLEGTSDGLHGSATVGLRREDVQDTDASVKVSDAPPSGRSARDESATWASGVVPKSQRARSARARDICDAERGSSALPTTAMRAKAKSDPSSRATASMLPSSSVCAASALVTSATSGRTSAAMRAISPGALEPHSITAARCASVSESRVKGAPMRLLRSSACSCGAGVRAYSRKSSTMFFMAVTCATMVPTARLSTATSCGSSLSASLACRRSADN